MLARRRAGRINLRLLIILALTGVFILGGGAVAYKVRKRVMANRALEAGRKAFEQEDWQEASTQLRFYVSKYPDDQEVLLEYAQASLSIRPSTVQSIGAALGAYRRFLRNEPGHPEVAVKAARLYLMSAGNPSDAAHICRQRLEVAPDDPEAMLLLGQALAVMKNSEEATQVLTSLVNSHPDQTKAYVILSQLAARDGDDQSMDRARHWLDEAVKANPQSAEAHVHRARFRREILDDWDGARADLEAAESEKNDDPEVILWIADEWIKQGELELASRSLAALDEIDPNSLDNDRVDPADLAAARFRMKASLDLQQQARVEGAELADKALNTLTDKRRDGFLPLAVRLYLAADDKDKARQCLAEYKEVVAKNDAYGTSSTGATNSVSILTALLAAAEGRAYDVINELEPLLERLELEDRGSGPEAILPRRVLANAYAATGQEVRAIAAWREYVQLAPDDMDTTMRLAKALLTTDPTSAIEYASVVEQKMPEEIAPKLIRIQGQLYLAGHKENAASDLSQLATELEALQDGHPDDTALAKLRIQLAKLRGEPVWDDSDSKVVAELKKEINTGAEPQKAALKLSEHYAGLERWPDAIAACKKAIELAPDVVDGYVFLAHLLNASGEKEMAKQTYEDAMARFSGRIQMSVKASYAEFLLNSGDLEGGLKTVRDLVKDHNNPGMVEGMPAAKLATGQAMLAELIMRYGAREEGINILQSLRQQYPDHVGIRNSLLKAPEIFTNTAEAQAIVDEIRNIEGERGLEWRIAQARVWLQTPSWADHAAEIENLLEVPVRVTPELTKPVLILGTLYERMGDDEKAIETYHRSIDADPNNVVVASRLLDVLERLRRYDEAEGILNNLVTLRDELGEYRTNITMGRRDYNAAVSQLEARIVENPEDASARILLARLTYGVLHEPERALQLLEEADRIHPGMQAALVVRIAILRAEGRLDEAVAILNGLVEQRGDFESYLNRARYYADERQNNLAEKDLLHLTTFSERKPQAYGMLARFYRSVDRMADALASCRKGMESAPNDRPLRILLSEILLAMDDAEHKEEGKTLLAGLLRDFPEDPQLLMRQAMVLLDEKDAESSAEAEELLEHVIKVQPRNATAHLLLIEQARINGQESREEALLNRAVAANGDDTRVLMAQATHAHLAGDIQEAARYAKLAVKIDPDHVVANNYLAEMRMLEGDFNAARKYNDRAIKVAPSDETSWIIHANLLGAQNRIPEAVSSLREYLQTEIGKKADRAWAKLGLFLLMQRDVDSAEEALASTEAIAPNTDHALDLRMRILQARGDFEGLRGQLEAYQQGDRDVSPALLVEGARLIASAGTQQYFEYAEQLLTKVTKSDPENAEAHLFHGMVLHRLKRVPECVEQYRRVLELDSHNLQALNDLAWILNDDLNEPEQALDLADRGVATYPDDSHLLDTRAVILERLGRLADAREDLERCLETSALPPTKAQALLHLGRVLSKLGEIDAARARFNEALELDKQYKCLSTTDREEIRSLMES